MIKKLGKLFKVFLSSIVRVEIIDCVCGNCDFSRYHGNGCYECHRYPPIGIDKDHFNDAIWPRVYDSDYCGGWKLKEKGGSGE